YFFHSSFCFIVYNSCPGNKVSPLSSIRNGIAHIFQSAFIHQVNNQLHFMYTFEISNCWLITCVNQRFNTCFHQTTQTTTKYGLLTKQVCFCFFLERSFKYTSSCCTDSSYIRKCYFCCFSSIILKYTI